MVEKGAVTASVRSDEVCRADRTAAVNSRRESIVAEQLTALDNASYRESVSVDYLAALSKAN